MKFDDSRQILVDQAFSGYHSLLGLRLSALRQGHAVVGFTPRADMLTPWKTLHGAIVNSLVELPSFLALLTELAPGEMPVTNDVFIQHLGKMPGDADYEVEGKLIRRGRTMAWCEVEVRALDRVVSIARITKTILPADNAAPRSRS